MPRPEWALETDFREVAISLCRSSCEKHGRASTKRRNPGSPTLGIGKGNTKHLSQINNMNFNNGRRHSKDRKIHEGRRCWETVRLGKVKRTHSDPHAA